MAVDRPHLILPTSGARQNFSLRGGGGRQSYPPAVADRRANARRILRQIKAISDEVALIDDPILDEQRIPMTARATTDWGVNTSLPASRRNEILSVVGLERRSRVNIALDPDTIENFETAAARYVDYRSTDSRRPNHFHFFEAKPELAVTTVEDLWASNLPLPEEGEEAAWEIWLQPAAEPRLREVLSALGMKSRKALVFEQTRVLRVEGTREQLSRLARSAIISQLRPASSLNADLLGIPAGVQAAAVLAAARRVSPAPATSPAVCILDTGIRSAHPLLTASLDLALSVPGAPAEDWTGHGTRMAGLALFDDLAGLVGANGRAQPAVRLESVTLDPPPGAAGAARLPAERLRQAVDLVESDDQDRTRTFCLAMNAPEDGTDGGPSSLSCELDALASDVSQARLFCVAAGNIDDPLVHTDYQSLNEVTGMLSPSQAWNALSVAACTDRVAVPATHDPLAPAGDLSPWSRTSVNWERGNKPPVKPDVVYEGGNQMVDKVSSTVGHHSDLCLLTTSDDLAAPLTLTGQTSAATAAVAGLCGRIQAEYPELWPETVRALVAHSAEYTPAMERRARTAASGRGGFQKALLERFGFGRPNAAGALQNASDALTLINEATLRPLRLNENENALVLGQMRTHRLPWSVNVLESLGQTPAELRVTLSYFVEPNPGALLRGEYENYASHGFEFEVKRPDETEEQAIARLNSLQAVRRESTADSQNWTFGPHRGRGGLKHDRLHTTAADLARMGSILVYPRKGWWGADIERAEQQARYSLVVTIRTPEQDIYNAIATEILTEIEV